MKYKFTGTLAIVSVIFFHSTLFAQQLSNKYVSVDGHKMQYQTAGKGSATVVFENGHASELNDWDDVFPEVAKFAKVVRYNRMGYGFSEASNKPRTFVQIATELHSMLRAAKISPPYILVGHSMGGALVRAFASLYKNETVGIVMVDPFNEFEVNGIPKDVIESFIAEGDSMFKNMPPVYSDELKDLNKEITTGFPEIKSFETPDVPTVLMVAGKNPVPNIQNNMYELFKARFRDLSDSRFVLLSQSPHYIQTYDPVAVIENIRRVVFPDVENPLRKILKEQGVDSVIAHYKKIKVTYPVDLVRERILNRLGYDALAGGNVPAAVKLFSMNVEAYPNSYNVYDSLGEAYLAAGNKPAAIKNYERSFKMNRGNTNAQKMLKKLKQG